VDRVGEVADAVALDVQVQLPAHGLGVFLGVAVQLKAYDLVIFPARLYALEQYFGGAGAGDHFRVVAGGKGGAGVTFVALPHGAHVDKENIVFTQHRVAVRALVESLEGIGAKAHQQRMPDALHVELGEYLFAQLTRLGFEHAGANALGEVVDGLPGDGLGVAHGVDTVGGAHGFFGLCSHRFPLALNSIRRYAFYYIAM